MSVAFIRVPTGPTSESESDDSLCAQELRAFPYANSHAHPHTQSHYPHDRRAVSNATNTHNTGDTPDWQSDTDTDSQCVLLESGAFDSLDSAAPAPQLDAPKQAGEEEEEESLPDLVTFTNEARARRLRRLRRPYSFRTRLFRPLASLW